MINSLWRLLRPYQWLKNSFVLVGLIFSRKYSDPGMLSLVLMAALAFSLVSSAVYVLNDIFDREQDRLHPQKRLRPLAAGDLGVRQGFLIFSVVLALGLSLGFTVSPALAGILLFYLLQNIAYSRRLKHVVILDVFLIALGFMLRILAGTWGVGIEPSRWLLLCGLMLALFMGFGKRWAELHDLESGAQQHRAVLDSYSHVLLEKMMGIAASGVIITYSLYTVDDSTVLQHGTDELIYTVPLVIYGVFRYLYLLHERGVGGDPARLVLKDSHILIVVLLWLGSVVWILR
ncbi:MAG: decaprenyl-phosphate phosphoribosyltransferase [Desulfitobacteriaceae bacterium]